MGSLRVPGDETKRMRVDEISVVVACIKTFFLLLIGDTYKEDAPDLPRTITARRSFSLSRRWGVSVDVSV